jgi:TonB family protein
MIWKEVVVDVRVKVDAAGKVVSAEPVRMSGPMRPFLERAAADAARLWRFEPARLGDQKVEGEALIQFRFRPTNTQQQQ